MPCYFMKGAGAVSIEEEPIIPVISNAIPLISGPENTSPFCGSDHQNRDDNAKSPHRVVTFCIALMVTI
jgi:hypothetical protein